jgi:outer membrane protein TolC
MSAHVHERGFLATVVCACTLLTAVLAAGAVSSTNTPLDLDAAIQRALARNRQLALAALSVQQRELETQSSREAFALTAGPFGRVDRTDDGTAWRYGLRAARKTAWGTEIGAGPEVSRYPSYVDEDWRSAVVVDARQPLFRRFGPAYTLEPRNDAGDRLAAERRRLEQQRAGLIVELVDTFERVVRLERQVEADQRVLERLAQTRELTSLRERQGRASGVDVLRAEQQHGEGVSRLDTDREALYQSRRDLAELLGAPVDAEFRLVSPPLPEIAIPDAASAVATALSNRLDYAQTLQDYRSAQRKARLARRGLQPDVTLVARYEQFGDEQTFGRSTTLDESRWTLGVGGDVDVVRAREHTAVQSAALDVEAARATVRLREQTLARDVQQAVSAYRRARAELTNAGRTQRVGEARVDLAHRLFEAGRGDSFSVAEAEQGFVAAEISLLNARAEASVASYRLLQELGTLVECPESLKPRPMEEGL